MTGLIFQAKRIDRKMVSREWTSVGGSGSSAVGNAYTMHLIERQQQALLPMLTRIDSVAHVLASGVFGYDEQDQAFSYWGASDGWKLDVSHAIKLFDDTKSGTLGTLVDGMEDYVLSHNAWEIVAVVAGSILIGIATGGVGSAVMAMNAAAGGSAIASLAVSLIAEGAIAGAVTDAYVQGVEIGFGSRKEFSGQEVLLAGASGAVGNVLVGGALVGGKSLLKGTSLSSVVEAEVAAGIAAHEANKAILQRGVARVKDGAERAGRAAGAAWEEFHAPDSDGIVYLGSGGGNIERDAARAAKAGWKELRGPSPSGAQPGAAPAAGPGQFAGAHAEAHAVTPGRSAGVPVVQPEGSEILYRRPAFPETAEQLGVDAARAARAKSLGVNKVPPIHGVSASADPLVNPGAASAPRRAIEEFFNVVDTPTRKDPLHRTIELPDPVTPEAAELLNQLFGRQR